MTAPRPLPAIAADLREIAPFVPLGYIKPDALADELDAHAAEHVCVPKDRWPTADEIAELRPIVDDLRIVAVRDRNDGYDGDAAVADEYADRIATFLNRLDPPTPADDDVDPWALLAAVVAPVQSGAEMPERMAAIDAARAALAARDTEERGR